MNKIEFDKIEFKNFLSFGNTWQNIVYQKGMSLIQGFDINTGKSNGSGKSSIVELIPFALYGQTIKDIKKDKIPNWFNNAKCEVKLYFHIADDNYYIYRSIKPNKFIVKKNDEQIPQLSNVRDFQTKINEEVLGMDFKTFSNLVYFSPNTSVSILNAKKEQKRKFLESLFDLKEYSLMMTMCNAKLSSIKGKIDIKSNDIEHYDVNIHHLQEDIENSKVPDLKELTRELNLKKMRLDGLVEKEEGLDFDKDQYSLLSSFVEELEGDSLKIINEISDIQKDISHNNEMIGTYHVDSIAEQHEKVAVKIAESQESLKLTDIYTWEHNLPIREGMVTTLDEVFERGIFQIDKAKGVEIRLVATKQQIYINNKDIDKQTDIDTDSDCPVCKQTVDARKLEQWGIDARAKNQEKLDELDEKIAKVEKTILILEGNQEKKKKAIQENQEVLQYLRGDISAYHANKDKLDTLQSMKDSLDSVEEIKAKISMHQGSIDESTKKLATLVHQKEMNELDLDIKTDTLQKQTLQKEEADKVSSDITELDADIKALLVRYEDYSAIVLQEEEKVNDKVQQIKDIEVKIAEDTASIKRFHLLVDHLEYMKVSLKDENIKQYAISSLLPFLNKQTNHYLSTSGFPYTVMIDGWLDVEIKGFGVDDVSYNSLSGGERKSIDIAIQFACNDIASLQASSVLGIGIYDEILDTSLDAQSLEPILEIMRVKQKEADSSVYIISHKEEIKELNFDHYMNVEKRNGFSTVKVKE